MIYYSLKNSEGEEISGNNIFNASLAELLMAARKRQRREFEKIERHGRRGFIAYRIDGNVETYQQY